MATLGKLKPVFAAKGSVTAGNSSQTSDGAGALLLVSEKILKQFNLTPLARFVSFAVKGVPPEIMGIGPSAAVPLACQAAGISSSQLDWIELNEAFAAQSLAGLQDLQLDPHGDHVYRYGDGRCGDHRARLSELIFQGVTRRASVLV